MTRRFSWLAGPVLAGLLAAPAVEAYTPSPAFIMSLAAKKRAGQKLAGLRVVVRRTDFAEGQQVGNPVDITITYRAGGRVRKAWTDAAGPHVRIIDGAMMLAVDGDNAFRGAAEPDLLDALWPTGEDEREAAMGRAMEVLRGTGVSESSNSLARMDGRIAWVVGAEPKDLTSPQAWVDKDDLLPVRFIRRGPPPGEGALGPVIDTRLRSWSSAIGGDLYPGRIETWRDGALTGVDELVRVEPNPKVDDREFKVD